MQGQMRQYGAFPLDKILSFVDLHAWVILIKYKPMLGSDTVIFNNRHSPLRNKM